MRKIALLLIVSFVIPTSSWATTKPIPGKSCIKVGSVEIVGSLKFTCIKTGNKLVWSKGTKFSTKKSTEADVKNPISKPSSSPSSSVSATLSKLQSTWREIQQLKSEKPVPALALDIRYSPTVNQAYAKSVLVSLNAAAQFWQTQFLPDKPFPVLVFSEKDEDWYKNQLMNLGVGNEFITQKINQYRSQVQ